MDPEQIPLTFGGGSDEAPKPMLTQPSSLRTVYSISCGMGARDFFELLRLKGVTALVDTRRSTTYRGARFAHGDDLPYLCKRCDIAYHHLLELAPTKELRGELHRVLDRKDVGDKEEAQRRRAQAWTDFLKAYRRLLTAGKVLQEGSRLRQLLYGADVHIAFMCACRHHLDCHRRVLVGLIGYYVEGVSVEHLSPDQVGGEAPRLVSPRRYLLEPIVDAGIEPNFPPGWRAS